jgi:hypothetical protein
MMKISLLLLSAAFVFIAGCRASPEKQDEQRFELINADNAELNARDACCVGLENARIKEEWPKLGNLTGLKRDGDVGDFGTGKTYFLGLSIPDGAASRRLLIKQRIVLKERDPHASATLLSSLPGEGSGYIMQPFVAFLGADHHVLSETKAPVCFDRGFDHARTGFFSGVTAPDAAKFAVIFTRPLEARAGFNHRYSMSGGTIGMSYTFADTEKIYFGPTAYLELGYPTDDQVGSLHLSPDPECAAVVSSWGYQFKD